jgi:hypothetical protein
VNNAGQGQLYNSNNGGKKSRKAGMKRKVKGGRKKRTQKNK